MVMFRRSARRSSKDRIVPHVIACLVSPLRPRISDRSFALLGIELVTSGHCNWTNYADYNDALRAAQGSLQEVAGARLIDAHSFCWMLVRPELALAPDHSQGREDRDSD